MIELSPDYYKNKWSLSQLKIITKTKTSHIYKARYFDKDVVLKLLTDVGRIYEAPGAVALSRWTSGAVDLLQYDHGAHLLEFIPGEDLESVVKRGQDKAVPNIICKTLNKIHNGEVSKAEVMSLKSSFASLIKRGQNMNSPEYIKIGYKLAMELLEAPRDEVLLHGDIHHNNIMQRQSGEWVVIDPKSLWGERAYDYANCFYNPDQSPEVVSNKERILYYANVFSKNINQPVDYLLKYAYAHGALSISWSMDGGDTVERRVVILKIINELLNN